MACYFGWNPASSSPPPFYYGDSPLLQHNTRCFMQVFHKSVFQQAKRHLVPEDNAVQQRSQLGSSTADEEASLKVQFADTAILNCLSSWLDSYQSVKDFKTKNPGNKHFCMCGRGHEVRVMKVVGLCSKITQCYHIASRTLWRINHLFLSGTNL